MLIGIEPEHNPVITDPHPLDIYVLLLQKTDDLGWRSATACLDPEEGGEGIDGRDEFGQIIAQGVDPRLAKLRGLLLFGQDCDHEGDRASNDRRGDCAYCRIRCCWDVHSLLCLTRIRLQDGQVCIAPQTLRGTA